jgi:hypothetical protein
MGGVFSMHNQLLTHIQNQPCYIVAKIFPIKCCIIDSTHPLHVFEWRVQGILHDWNDEHCIKILKNCWTALSNGGKLIILDQIMPMETPLEGSVPKVRQNVFVTDTLMQFHCPSGRERTAMELEGLLKQAGFTNFQVVAEVGFNYVMEAFK